MANTDSTPGTPLATAPTLPRVVPGAPPPVPVSKSQQKKKRKSQLKNLAASAHEAALTDHAPDADDIRAGKVDPALLANPAPGSSAPDTGNNTEAEDGKTAEHEKSVVVEAINKRHKALVKKAQRVNEYKSEEKLNDDQKAAIASLPVLEGTVKELESIKKTVETLEAGLRRTRAQERTELQKAHEQRVSEAARHAEASLLPRITSLISFLALRNLLTHATPTDLSISEPERNAILSAGDVLLAHPPLGHVEEIVKGFLSGAGSWEDVEYARLVEITSQFVAPRTPTPIPDIDIPLDPTTLPDTEPIEPAADLEPEPEPEPEVEPEIIATDLGLPITTSMSGAGYHFMQESELDAPAEMTESQEWVAVQPTAHPEDAAVEVADETELAQADIGELPTVEVSAGAEVAEGVTGGGAPLDWADAGDHDLPDLGGLQATFGGSGSQTPIAQPASSAPAAATGPVTDDDGFTSIPGRRGTRGTFGGERGYRGRGRGRGGFRGGEGGGYRGDRGEGGEGGEGGGHREGGGYRGRGGYRGASGEGGEGAEGGGYRGRGGRGGDGGEGGRGRGRGFGGGWAQGQGQEGGRGGRGAYRGERRGSADGRPSWLAVSYLDLGSIRDPVPTPFFFTSVDNFHPCRFQRPRRRSSWYWHTHRRDHCLKLLGEGCFLVGLRARAARGL
ncbi:hypothetical protein FS749_010869 [Ceratobasidium sp. UAMH 11750]|nr:hypothetical protein FS749_010869 [Ceratobasidium sp. UAMH 11750]